MRNLLAISIIAITVLGCGGQWVTLKNGQSVSESEISKDKLYCQREAALLFPYAAAINSSGAGSSSSATTNCSKFGSSVNCTTSGGYTAPRVTTADGNASNREKYYRSCIDALGYKQEFIQDQEETIAPQSKSNYGVVNVGGPCKNSNECLGSLQCIHGDDGLNLCQRNDVQTFRDLRFGDTCKNSSECAGSYNCLPASDGIYRCQLISKLGLPCANSGECGEGLKCISFNAGNFSCSRLPSDLEHVGSRKLGDLCKNSQECPGMSRCVPNTDGVYRCENKNPSIIIK